MKSWFLGKETHRAPLWAVAVREMSVDERNTMKRRTAGHLLRLAAMACVSVFVARSTATFAQPVVVPLDIKPGGCPNRLNVNAEGTLPAAILGTEDFDVTRIDPASISLNREALIWEALNPAVLQVDSSTWTEVFDDPTTSPVNTFVLSAAGDVTAALVDCGFGLSTDIPPEASSAICLIERSDVLFRDMVQNAANGGAVGVIVYNRPDTTGNVRGTLLTPSAIPAVSVSYVDGLSLLAALAAGSAAHIVVDSTIALETLTVSPIAWSLNDVGTPFDGAPCACSEAGLDGLTDLVLKFDVPAVVEQLELPFAQFPRAEVNINPVILLEVDGNLSENFGSTPIEDTDCVVVKWPRRVGRR